MRANGSEVTRTDVVKGGPVVVVGELGWRRRCARQKGQVMPAILRERAKGRVAEIEHTRGLPQLGVEFALEISELLDVIAGGHHIDADDHSSGGLKVQVLVLEGTQAKREQSSGGEERQGQRSLKHHQRLLWPRGLISGRPAGAAQCLDGVEV